MKKFLAIGTALALTLGLSACAESPDDENYVGFCQDREGNRVEDTYCPTNVYYSNGPSGSEMFFWGYLLSSMNMPRVGAPVGSGVVYRIDDTRYNVYRGGVPTTGGKVNYDTYKPLASKVVKPDVSVKSQTYKNAYINQDSTYKQKDSSKNNTYNSGSKSSCCKSGSSGGSVRVGGRR